MQGGLLPAGRQCGFPGRKAYHVHEAIRIRGLGRVQHHLGAAPQLRCGVNGYVPEAGKRLPARHRAGPTDLDVSRAWPAATASGATGPSGNRSGPAFESRSRGAVLRRSEGKGIDR